MALPNKPQLQMLRPTLEPLAALRLPEEYAIRSYLPGDSKHWTAILADSFEGEPSKYSFDRIMRADPAYRAGRVFFVCHRGSPVGTASAYISPTTMANAGMLHYVGVMKAHAGKRLGSAVSLAALMRMRAEGRDRVWLSTDDFRLPAIKTYLRLGFEPFPSHPSHRDRWPEVFQRLNMPECTERFDAILRGPLWSPAPWPADACDYAKRLHPRRRWHPARAAGTLHQDDTLAREDESLYKPSELGSAGASLSCVTAGENRPFELWYRAGTRPLDAGTEVRFLCVGQNSLGIGPQASDAAKPGFVELTAAPEGVTLEPLSRGFRVSEGQLCENDEVRLGIGRQGGASWTPVAGRKDIVVTIDPGRDEPKMHLPEPVVIRVLPQKATRLEVVLPMTPRGDEPLEAGITVRDAFDNRVAADGPVDLTFGGQDLRVHLRDGLGTARIPHASNEVVRVRAVEADSGIAAASNPCVPRGELGLYVGDMHVHDATSEAEGYMADTYRWAIEDRRLDFISVPVQCHNNLDNEKWHLAKHMAETFLDEGRFVNFLAFEWQHSQYGDKVVHFLGGNMPYLPVDDPRYAHPAGLYEALRGTDAFIISHHPGYTTNLWVPGTDYGAIESDVDRCVELWSMHGSSEGYDPEDRPLRPPRRPGGVMQALRDGLRTGLLAGSDTHTGRAGGSAKEPLGYWGGLCAVWAKELTRRSLFEAFMARRTYALTGARIALQFTVNDAPMGTELPLSDEARILIDVWAPSPIAKVEIMRRADVWQTHEPGEEECHLAVSEATLDPTFYHCRVTLKDGNLAVCTPVWVG